MIGAMERSPPGLRTAYRAHRPITTRWMDNDVFQHVNNVTYYSYFDTAVTGWLMERDLIGFNAGPMWMVAETGCRFLDQLAFPDAVTVGLRIGRLGTSSVRWELAIFRNDAAQASAEGHFVHVFVDRTTRRPTPIPDSIRGLLAPIAA